MEYGGIYFSASSLLAIYCVPIIIKSSLLSDPRIRRSFKRGRILMAKLISRAI
jgi:hypothetical protein